MNLTQLKRITERGKKRLGQGHGSGKVKTSGRGQKGQKARGDIPLFFEGGALPLIKRLPFLRGKGRNMRWRKKAVIVNVGELNSLAKNSIIDMKTLILHNLVDKKDAAKYGIKILGEGELKTALTVKLPISKGAKEKIEKAGGTIVLTE
jgi:large subunit ribosomal protein L15